MVKFGDLEAKETAARLNRCRLQQVGDYYVFVTSPMSRYRRSNVYVLDLYLPELAKLIALELMKYDHTGMPLIYTAACKLVARHWLVAKNVYDGLTYKSGGWRARQDAIALAKRLDNGEQIPPTWERKQNDGKRSKSKKKDDRHAQ